MLTENLSIEEIVKLANERPEFSWKWNLFLKQKETEEIAKENGLVVHWWTPIRPGDLYLAKRNTGYHLLTCEKLGDAWVQAKENAYSFDFSECILVT